MQNIKLKRIDWIIIFVCLMGTLFCGIAFWMRYNQTLTKLNETPVAVITFKKNTAQRRFIDRGVWDRLKLSTPVYNGDTIRTVVQSEAVVVFEDEVTYLGMDENTMIQIFADKRQGKRIDLAEGNLELDSTSSEQNIVVSMEGNTIAVNGQVVINKTDEGLSLAVIGGEANLNETKIESGTAIMLDSSGEINPIPMIAMTSFGSSVRILGNPNEAASILFSWNEINFSPDTYVIVEVAKDRMFKNIEAAREVRNASSISIPLAVGTYRWRAYPVNENSREPLNGMYPSGSLEIIPASIPVLESPLADTEIIFVTERNVSFSWSKLESAASYLLEISRNANMNAPVISRSVNKTSVTQNNLDEGVWYWCVTPEYPARIIGDVPSSAVGNFSLTKDVQVLSVPVLTPSEKNETVSAENSFEENFPKENEIVSEEELPDENLSEKNIIISEEKIPVEELPEEKPIVKTKPILPIIYFSANTAETIEAEENTFAHIAFILNANPEYTITIEGHANYTIDPANIAARLREQTNELIPLSEMRAKAAAENLIRLGIAPERINAVGIGGEKPLAVWDDVSNWQHNRRVEFVLEE